MTLSIWETPKGFKYRFDVSSNWHIHLGQTNGNGWTLVSIQHLYKGKFINSEEFFEKIRVKNHSKKNKFFEIIKILFDIQ